MTYMRATLLCRGALNNVTCMFDNVRHFPNVEISVELHSDLVMHYLKS